MVEDLDHLGEVGSLVAQRAREIPEGGGGDGDGGEEAARGEGQSWDRVSEFGELGVDGVLDLGIGEGGDPGVEFEATRRREVVESSELKEGLLSDDVGTTGPLDDAVVGVAAPLLGAEEHGRRHVGTTI